MALFSNFYFFYSITILMAAYYLFRFLEIYKGAYWKNITVFIKGIWRYCLGVVFALPLFLPVLNCFLNSARFNYASSQIPVIFEKTYYIQFFSWLIAPYNNNVYCTMLEYSGIVLFCIIALYLNRGNKALKLGIAVCFAVLLIPQACYVMNAGAYITNRWTYGLAFFIGIAVVKSFDFLPGNSKRLFIGMSLGAACYLLVAYYIHKKLGTAYSLSLIHISEPTRRS